MKRFNSASEVQMNALGIQETRMFNDKKIKTGKNVICITRPNMTEDWMINASRDNLYWYDEGRRTPILPLIMGVSKKFASEYIKMVNEDLPDLKISIISCDEIF